MGRRGSSSFRAHWHDRTLDLDDGDVLRWLVIAAPGRDPWIAYFRRDAVGAIHALMGVALLERAGHPDAVLPVLADTPSAGLTH